MKPLNSLKESNKIKLDNTNKLIECTEKILKSTIQFFEDGEKLKVKGVGSGVLFEINNNYFIFTAAHVYTDNRERTYVYSNNEPISLEGMLYTTHLPKSGFRGDDKTDIAIINIFPATVEKLKIDYEFITISNIELGHYIDINTNYILAGYPNNKTKELWGMSSKALKTEPFVANLDTFVRFNYEKYNFKVETHIAIEYSGEVISHKNKNPHLESPLHGISGSGLWHVNYTPDENLIQAKLIGIIIEQIAKDPNNKAIIATRIDIIIKYISMLFNLNLSIPKQSNKWR